MQCLENPSLSLLSLVRETGIERETGPRKDRGNPLTRVEFEQTTHGIDYLWSTDWATKLQRKVRVGIEILFHDIQASNDGISMKIFLF